MIRSFRLSVVAAVVTCAVSGQQKAAQPAFEVVSVKRTPPASGDPVGLFTYPGGRIHATNYTLKQLIRDAYNVEEYRILDGPQWVDDDRFSVEAKPPVSSEASKWTPANFKSPPNSEMRQMMQTLLAERFQLKVHTETRRERVYALVTAKGGPKLALPKSTTVQPFVSYLPHGLSGQNATMDQLVERLASILKRPVSNRTAIEGHFDFLIDYPPDDAGTDYTARLLGAIQDQLGLKLETQQGSVEVLVIDRAEKPSAN
jgi:uncharacterized protein (TIGR03435 family)